MPLFTILRRVPGATRDDIDAASLRALICATEFPGLRWVRSYWDSDGETILCLYEGKDAEQIAEHSRRSRIPCDEVREIVEFGPDDYVAPVEESAAAATFI